MDDFTDISDGELSASQLSEGRFFDFQDGGRPPSWIFKRSEFLPGDRVEMDKKRHHAKFRGNRSNHCRDIAI